jgi:Protein of unknown function (DUF4058)
MPSPFPGMNPYFEQPAYWQDFPIEFLTALRRLLVPQLGGAFIVQLEEHVYIHDLPPEPRRLVGRADLSVAPSEMAVTGQAALGLLEAPTEVQLPAQDIERVPFLEVRDRQGRQLLTVIELLSPSNKRPGEDREHYLAKRRELLRSPAHLVELDLLRQGPTMPAANRPACDYSVLISRAQRRPVASFWPIRFRERLPIIPIPLRTDVEEVYVDLQEVLHRAYDGPGYENFIYGDSTPPSLSDEDVAWATQFVPRKSSR